MGATIRVRLTSEETAGSYSIIEMIVPPHFPVAPPHYHTSFSERFVVLDGELEVQLDGVRHLLRSGESSIAGRNVWHALQNSADNPAHFLIVATPGGHEKFFYELINWMNREPQWPPADRTRLLEFGRRHDSHYE
jgi:quercetin dioxygenase-like cupin family protein